MTKLIPPEHHKTILVILIVALGVFVIYILREFIPAILGAILLYTLFKPLYTYFSVTKKMRKGIAAMLVMVISFIIIIVPFTGASLMIIEKVAEFRSQPLMINHIMEKGNAMLGKQFN